jgi:hypothetical protein
MPCRDCGRLGVPPKAWGYCRACYDHRRRAGEPMCPTEFARGDVVSFVAGDRVIRAEFLGAVRPDPDTGEELCMIMLERTRIPVGPTPIEGLELVSRAVADPAYVLDDWPD